MTAPPALEEAPPPPEEESAAPRARAAERSLPHDLAAEQCVLGAAMLSKDVIGDLGEIIAADDFYAPRHAIIWRTVMALYAAGHPVDPISMTAALAESGELAKVGGVPYLHEVVATPPTAANGAYYARIVADRSSRRRVVEAGVRISQLGYSTGHEGTEIVDLAQGEAMGLTRRGHNQWSTLGDLLQPTLDEIEILGATAGEMRGIPTGFTDLDRLTSGLQAGQLVIVAGRPGMGKSTLGLNIAQHAAIAHHLPSAVFSLEMSKSEITMRILSAEARVPLHLIRSGQLRDEDWTKMGQKFPVLAEAPLLVDDTPSMTLMEIRSKARRLKQQNDLRLIVVDYLQLMTSPSRKHSNRQEEVAEMSRGLKLLAKEVECPVIAVAQLNRGPENRPDKRPLLSDLRESGSVEQDADLVILLHRDDYYDKDSPRAGECDFIVAKHRNGPTDTLTVAAQLHLSRFVDMSIT